MADTFIQDGVTPNYGYQVATLYLGFEKAYEISKDEKYLDWYKGQIDDHVVLENGTIKNWNYTRYVLDEYRIANNYLYLYDKTGLEKYKSAANIVRNMINSTPRSPSGGFW
jgi:rhamnogalacturonyl hydrolase YesR